MGSGTHVWAAIIVINPSVENLPGKVTSSTCIRQATVHMLFMKNSQHGWVTVWNGMHSMHQTWVSVTAGRQRQSFPEQQQRRNGNKCPEPGGTDPEEDMESCYTG